MNTFCGKTLDFCYHVRQFLFSFYTSDSLSAKEDHHLIVVMMASRMMGFMCEQALKLLQNIESVVDS